MRRLALISTLLLAAAFLFVISCSKNDTVRPVIKLNGADTIKVALKGTFTDPGATATDDEDGNISPVVTGTVNINSAGWYILTYTATDHAGNAASVSRAVDVDAALYVAGLYQAVDTCGGITSPPYFDTITATPHLYNKIHFTRFANYLNGSVYATIAGTTITVPQQDVICGSPSKTRTFSGYGSFTELSMEIHYTKVTNDSVATGVDIYERY